MDDGWTVWPPPREPPKRRSFRRCSRCRRISRDACQCRRWSNPTSSQTLVLALGLSSGSLLLFGLLRGPAIAIGLFGLALVLFLINVSNLVLFVHAEVTGAELITVAERLRERWPARADRKPPTKK